MATVSGYTVERLRELENGTVIDGRIEDGHLILVRFDEQIIDAGPVTGPMGPVGALEPGLIFSYGGDVAPAGYLLCDGAAVSRVTYSDLFEVVNEKYGIGNGVTTFNVPDLRKRVAVGFDATDADFNVLGKKAGAKTHQLSIAEMPLHGHAADVVPNHSHSEWAQVDERAVAAGSDYGVPSATSLKAGTTSPAGAHTPVINQTGGGGAHNNLQPYIVLHSIIKT